MRQMPERSGRASAAHGEAVRDPASDEACGPPREHQGTGSARSKAGAGTLLEAALTRENLQAAWKRARANKRAAGVDGLDIEQTAALLQTSWPPTARHPAQALEAGSTIYRELKALGATHDVAKHVAVNGRRWWRNSAKLLNSVLTIAHFDRLGVPRLS
ncbi:MAG: hypothetical protein AB7S86_19660 [Hydrogenophaga sp.]